MNITVYIEQQNKNLKMPLDKNATISSLLQKIKVNPIEVVVAQNGEIVTEDAVISDGDDIKIFSVVSGG